MDILINNTGFNVRNGDFVIGDSIKQEVNLLLEIEKGELKQHPTTGVGIRTFLLSEDKESEIWKEINNELINDGFTNIEINKKNKTIKVSR